MNEMETGRDYRGSYRDDYRDYDYRNYDYRDNYRRDYDRRGGRINRRSYRNYRSEDYYEELENCMHELKEYSRALEDLADMSENPQEKNTLMRIAQREKEHYSNLKQMMEK